MLIASRRLGEFLIERRVLSRDLLEEMLVREGREGVHLSRLLVASGIVSEKDLVAAVADQIGVPFIDLTEHPIRPDVHGLVPEDIARHYLAVAVDRRPDATVVIAMEDPTDRAVIAAIEDDTRERVVGAIALRDELERVIDEMYSDDDDWHDAGRGAAEGPRLDDVLAKALEAGASDVHLTVGVPPFARCHGALAPLPGFIALNGSELRHMLYSVLSARQRAQFERERQLDTSHALPGQGRFRMSLFLQRDSVAAVLRAVPSRLVPFEKLGLPETVRDWAELDRGLVVVTGPTRSGRSTTLAALVDAVNERRACHVLTVEDPIEFLHAHKRAVVNQRQVGDDTTSFAAALRQALRQDPDVIMVGGLPDLETITTAINAAEAGVLVFATMHVPSAVGAVQRLVEVYPADQQNLMLVQLASCLEGVVAQQLVPSKGGHRVVAAEVLVGTPMVRDFIREGRPGQLAAAMGVGGDGMQTMEQALARLVQIGQVAAEVAVERCTQPDELRRLIRTSGAPPALRVEEIARSLKRESLRD